MPDSPSDRDASASPDELLADSPPGDNAAPLTVSEISAALKREVEGRFGHVRIRGEISGFKRAASGHCYLTLKDDRAVIDGVIWRGQGGRIAFQAEDGLDVVATGRLTTYPGRSKYQIVIEHLELAGQGALMQLLEKRRQALAAEGLFAEERKKRLPYLPRTIGVVTSPTGAVIRDILHRLEDRMPSHVVLWPVIVQGEGAAGQVAAAVRGFDAMEKGGPVVRPDLLIVARGGGSIEDLWAFNEEAVVRAIADCSIPVISAVGHETDTTLCDFVADRRAPTPTAAAEMAVPVRADLLATIAQIGMRADRAIHRWRERAADRLQSLARLMPRLDNLFAPHGQRVDDLADRGTRALDNRLQRAGHAFERQRDRLHPRMLDQRSASAAQRLAGLSRLLGQLHPDRPLEKGYARVTDRNAKTLVGADVARAAGALTLRFADGTVDARVEEDGAKPYPRRKAKRPALPGTGQRNLFD